MAAAQRLAVGLAPHLQTPAAEWALRPPALAFVPFRVRKHAVDLFRQLEALGEHAGAFRACSITLAQRSNCNLRA